MENSAIESPEPEPVIKKFPISISNRGHMCLWETGGSDPWRGTAQIIAGKDGLPMHPLVTRGGNRHAMFPVYAGCHVINAAHERQVIGMEIYRLTGFYEGLDSAPYWSGERIATYQNGEWDVPFHELTLYGLNDAISAAVDKCLCWHCHGTHYCRKPTGTGACVCPRAAE